MEPPKNRRAVGEMTNPQHPIQYSRFTSFLERNVKNYYYLLYEDDEKKIDSIIGTQSKPRFRRWNKFEDVGLQFPDNNADLSAAGRKGQYYVKLVSCNLQKHRRNLQRRTRSLQQRRTDRGTLQEV